MSFGKWNVDVVVNKTPEKIASAIADLNESILGGVYTPIAYLGSQLVNGTNHAVLAEQLLTTGKDKRNIVTLIFNEKNMDVTLVSIERVLESGEDVGGVVVNEDTTITPEASDILFLKAVKEYAGVKVEPFAFLGTQVVSGINYMFAAIVTPVTAKPEAKVCLLTINTLSDRFTFTDILVNRINADAVSLGSVSLQSPWTTYAEELMQFFKNDPDVKVVYDNMYDIKLYVEKDKKADALMRLLPGKKIFGNVTLNIAVVPANNFKAEEGDLSVMEVFERAFDENPALSYVKSENIFPGVDAPITYVVWAHEIVQFFNDDLADINGNKTTLYQDIAASVFGVFDNTYYCTDIDSVDADA